MNDLDKKIQAALRGSPGADELGHEPNIAEELVATFRGRRRWLNGIAFGWTLVLFLVAVWAGCEFFQADAMRDQLRWGGLTLLAALAVAMVKIYFWLELHTNRVLREVKRVELLLLKRETS